MSYTEMLLEDLTEADPMREDVAEVHRAGQRATGLTRQLLAFSRKQILQPVVIDLNEVVQGVHRMLGRLLGEDVELALVLDKNLGRIYADSGQLEQVILNLVVNARDAMPRGGHLTVETANVTIDSASNDAPPSTVPGDYVMLAVTDSGTGMDRETQERIFEPFFTTKDKSKGTGLGLSTVYGIVQQSGGTISVTSELEKGTTFRVYLPCTDRRPSDPTTGLPSLRSLRGAETILLVEDDVAVRHLMRAILRKSGYQVLEAENGGEAFLISEQSTAKIDLLLTDVVMPRMSGRQVAERLSAQRPEMKVLFVSGYTEDTIVRHGVMHAGIEFLAKPITPETLLRKVRSVLDA